MGVAALLNVWGRSWAGPERGSEILCMLMHEMGSTPPPHHQCMVDAAGECMVDAAGECMVDAAGECMVDAVGECMVDAAGECMVDAAGECMVDATGECMVDAAGECMVDAAGECMVDAAGECMVDFQIGASLYAVGRPVRKRNDEDGQIGTIQSLPLERGALFNRFFR